MSCDAEHQLRQQLRSFPAIHAVIADLSDHHRQVRARVRLDTEAQQRLADDIARIEASHFSRATDPSLDLQAVATAWLRTAV